MQKEIKKLILSTADERIKDTTTHSLMSKFAAASSGFLCDGLEDGVAAYLLETGVPKKDIVPAFHSPEKRQLTGFAVT